MANQTIDPSRTQQAESAETVSGVQVKTEDLHLVSEAQRRELLWDRMLAAGLISKRPSPRQLRPDRPPLIRCEGKPLSETIIEERR